MNQRGFHAWCILLPEQETMDCHTHNYKHITNPPSSCLLFQIFADPSLPILLDIGCAKGRWISSLAAELAVEHAAEATPPVRSGQNAEVLGAGMQPGAWYPQQHGGSLPLATRFGGRPHNFLGVEIFEPLVAAANAKRDSDGEAYFHPPFFVIAELSLPYCHCRIAIAV